MTASLAHTLKRLGSKASVVRATDVVEVSRQQVGCLASDDNQARLFDEDRGLSIQIVTAAPTMLRRSGRRPSISRTSRRSELRALAALGMVMLA